MEIWKRKSNGQLYIRSSNATNINDGVEYVIIYGVNDNCHSPLVIKLENFLEQFEWPRQLLSKDGADWKEIKND